MPARADRIGADAGVLRELGGVLGRDRVDVLHAVGQQDHHLARAVAVLELPDRQREAGANARSVLGAARRLVLQRTEEPLERLMIQRRRTNEIRIQSEGHEPDAITIASLHEVPSDRLSDVESTALALRVHIALGHRAREVEHEQDVDPLALYRHAIEHLRPRDRKAEHHEPETAQMQGQPGETDTPCARQLGESRDARNAESRQAPPRDDDPKQHDERHQEQEPPVGEGETQQLLLRVAAHDRGSVTA